jgi:hypothetical protein
MVKGDFRDGRTERDTEAMSRHWETMTEGRPEMFSEPQGRANLVTASPSGMHYQTTDYEAYSAVVGTNAMTANAYRDMRIASIGAAVQLRTGDIVSTFREGTSHASNLWSPSCAGVADIKDGKPDFEAALYRRLKDVLGIDRERVKKVGIVSVHAAGKPDYSGMIGYVVEVDAIKRNIKFKGRIEYVKPDAMSDFVIEHFGVRKDMNSDGAMCLMNVLEEGEFTETVKALQRRNNTQREINSGRLIDGSLE